MCQNFYDINWIFEALIVPASKSKSNYPAKQYQINIKHSCRLD